MRQTLVKADLDCQFGRHHLRIVDQNGRLLIRLPDEEPLRDVLSSLLGSISLRNLLGVLRIAQRLDIPLEVHRKDRILVAFDRDVGNRAWTLFGVPRGRYQVSFLVHLFIASLRRHL